MIAIRAEGLTKRYGDRVALRGVSFDVSAGEVVAVLGPNGAGKTTTLEILEGFLAPTTGTAVVLGAEPSRAGPGWRSRIGIVPQSTSLDLQLTAREALEAFAAVFPSPLPVAEVLELLDLGAAADTRIGRLSGGQQRRVDLGIAIVGRPELLFLDEPTTGLDPEARRRTWSVVRELARSGRTVVLSTHYMEEAEQLADRIVVLAAGRVAADATPAQLRSRAARSTIELPVPDRLARCVPPLPAERLDAGPGTLVVETDDVAGTLGALLPWSREHEVDLRGLEVGPPSLEDAYLRLVRNGAPSDD